MGAAAAVAAVVFLAFTCQTADVPSDCQLPADGSRQADILAEARSQAGFAILYPCKLPNSQRLVTVDVVGARGKQSVSIVFDGPFEITIRQSQVAPLVNADPAGASHIVLENLFPGVKADLIEINEGTSRALYHLVWSQAGMYYELLASGPPLQRRTVLEITRSLQ